MNSLIELLSFLDKQQWIHKPDFKSLANYPIFTRQELQKVKFPKGLKLSRTSGSTGEPVTIAKTPLDRLWHLATNIRETQWRKWDYTKNVASVTTHTPTKDSSSLGLPVEIAGLNQGSSFFHKLDTISNLQKWIELKNPHYFHSYPSIIRALDFSKCPNLIDIKSTGEIGGTNYSAEEAGTIALQCPDNPNVYHVMENIIVERDPDDGVAIITCLTNPWIKRYKIGDIIELGECTCGRTLQTITKIYGRVRNAVTYPNGDKKWPTIGSHYYYERFGIRQFQAYQTFLDTIELYILSERLSKDKTEELKALVQESLGYNFNVEIKYRTEFKLGKYEEFVSLLKE